MSIEEHLFYEESNEVKRTQIWCDASGCGRLIEDKKYEHGEDSWPLEVDHKDTAWEIWSPNSDEDQICCSLECLIMRAQELLTQRADAEHHSDSVQYPEGITS